MSSIQLNFCENNNALRLSVSLVASIVLHAFVFSLKSILLRAPSLSVSNQPVIVDLELVTQVSKPQVVPLPPKEEPKTTIKAPVVKKDSLRRINTKNEIPLPTLNVVEEGNQDDNRSLETKNNNYASDPSKEPRIIERAEYLNNPPPEYPEQARRKRQQGTVTLLVDINSEGFVTKLQIQKSSGFSLLDASAEKAVTNWRFTPAYLGSKAISSKVIVPVQFQLVK